MLWYLTGNGNKVLVDLAGAHLVHRVGRRFAIEAPDGAGGHCGIELRAGDASEKASWSAALAAAIAVAPQARSSAVHEDAGGGGAEHGSSAPQGSAPDDLPATAPGPADRVGDSAEGDEARGVEVRVVVEHGGSAVDGTSGVVVPGSESSESPGGGGGGGGGGEGGGDMGGRDASCGSDLHCSSGGADGRGLHCDSTGHVVDAVSDARPPAAAVIAVRGDDDNEARDLSAASGLPSAVAEQLVEDLGAQAPRRPVPVVELVASASGEGAIRVSDAALVEGLGATAPLPDPVGQWAAGASGDGAMQVPNAWPVTSTADGVSMLADSASVAAAAAAAAVLSVAGIGLPSGERDAAAERGPGTAAAAAVSAPVEGIERESDSAADRAVAAPVVGATETASAAGVEAAAAAAGVEAADGRGRAPESAPTFHDFEVIFVGRAMVGDDWLSRHTEYELRVVRGATRTTIRRRYREFSAMDVAVRLRVDCHGRAR